MDSSKDEILSLMKEKLRIYSKSIIREDYLLFLRIRKLVNKFILLGTMDEHLLLNTVVILTNRYEGNTHKILTKLLNKEGMSIINPFFVLIGWLETNTEMSEHSVEIVESLISQLNLHGREIL